MATLRQPPGLATQAMSAPAIPEDFARRYGIPPGTVPEHARLAPAPGTADRFGATQSAPTQDAVSRARAAATLRTANTASALQGPPRPPTGFVAPAATVTSPAAAGVPPTTATPALRAANAAGKVGGALSVASAVPQIKAAYDESSALDNGLDRVALAGERVGRFAGATAGAAGGASIGSVVPVVGTALGGLAGGAAGYFAPDLIKKATDFVGLTDADVQLPSDKAQGIIAERETLRQPTPAAVVPTDPTRAPDPSTVAPASGPIQLDPAQVAAANGNMQTVANRQLRDNPNARFDLGSDIVGSSTNGLRLNSFSGTGDGSRNRAYEAGDQYQGGVARAAQDKAALAAIEQTKRDEEYKSKGEDLMSQLRIGTQAQRRAARAGLEQRAASEKLAAEAGLRGQTNVLAQQRLILDEQNRLRDDRRAVQQNAQTQANVDRTAASDAEKTAFSNRQKAEEGFTNRLSTMFVGPDGKPDTAKVGLATQKVTEELGARIADLQAVPKSDPGYAKAQELSKRLSKEGIAALDEDDKNTLMSQLQIWQRTQDASGLLPGSASFRDSRLGGYAAQGTEKNLLGSDTITLRNGSRIRANDLRYADGPANTLLPDFKTPTDRFNAGLRRGN